MPISFFESMTPEMPMECTERYPTPDPEVVDISQHLELDRGQQPLYTM